MTRLQAVCSLITPAQCIADVGCDHGLVAEYCVKSGLCERVIASDISGECLQKARDRLSKYGNAEFYECDGIAYECDEAVLAGMGGRNIVNILYSAKTLPKTLVLCPHRDTESVRRKIIELGYGIETEILVKERKKFYFCMRASLLGGSRELSDLGYAFGLNFEKRCDNLREYLTLQYNTYIKAPRKNGDKLELVRNALRYQTGENKTS